MWEVKSDCFYFLSYIFLCERLRDCFYFLSYLEVKSDTGAAVLHGFFPPLIAFSRIEPISRGKVIRRKGIQSQCTGCIDLEVKSDCFYFLSYLEVKSDCFYLLSYLEVKSGWFYLLSYLEVKSNCFYVLSYLEVKSGRS